MRKMRDKIKLLILGVVIINSGFGVNVFAKLPEADVDIFSQNNITFYDPDECGTIGGNGTVYGNTIIEKLWTGLIGIVGLTPEQAAGVIGNMNAESGLSPARHESSNDEGLGLIQWSFGRKTNMYNYVVGKNPEMKKYLDDRDGYGMDRGEVFLEKAGDNVTNELIQYELEFLRDELKNNPQYSGIFDQKSVQDATSFFLYDVEVAGVANLDDRLETANSVYGQMKGKSVSGGGGSGKVDSCGRGQGGAGELQNYVLKYAWPDYKGLDTQMMPDYERDAARRQAEGFYVGACNGVDCGGFVTTLVNESGYLPDYNFGGKGGNVDSQYDWAVANMTLLNDGQSIDTSKLQPGDIAIQFDHEHTFIYVGDIPGFNSKIASASMCERAPMAGTESLDGNYWFRKK